MLRSSPRRLLRALGALPLIALSACTPSDAATPLPNALADTPLATAKGTETAVLAGGCFWGVQAVFRHVNGVTSVVSGYSGGAKETAEYYKVSSGTTGHAESVQITYDPSRITY
ncbi:MAG TPA: peptide-methionine (S)-S-oxide reductase, partial [Burkholderiales bacterium]|nr:peptide-methionine (S)-S-oxide reductase [Burkholderiales bacterium]